MVYIIPDILNSHKTFYISLSHRRWPMDPPHNIPVMKKAFLGQDVILFTKNRNAMIGTIAENIYVCQLFMWR